MSVIDNEIKKHYENSRKLKEIYMTNDKISYEKGRELQKQQSEEWDKLNFLKNLRKEINKKDETKGQTIRF